MTRKCKVCEVEIEFGYHVCFDEVLRRNPSIERDLLLKDLWVMEAVRARDAEESLHRIEWIIRLVEGTSKDVGHLIRKHWNGRADD